MHCPVPLPLLTATRLCFAAGLMAVVALFGAIYLDFHADAARLLALRNGPPVLVDLEDFDPLRDSGPTGEIHLRAQLDMSMPVRVIYRRGMTFTRAFTVPLLAVHTSDNRDGQMPEILGYLYLSAPFRRVEILDVIQNLPLAQFEGAHGSIIEINGETGVPGPIATRAAAALGARGRTSVESPLVVAPYPEGRAAALSRPRASRWRHVLMVLAALLLVSGVLLERRRARAVRRLPRAGARRPYPSRFPTEPTTEKGRRRLTPLAPSDGSGR